MTDSYLPSRLMRLRGQKETLLKELESTNDQWTTTLADSDREKLDKKIESLEAKVEKKEKEIEETNEKIRRLPISQGSDAKSSAEITLTVQIAVVAMTASQANTLASYKGGGTPSFAEAASKFAQICSHLTEYGINNVASCYGEKPDDWKPLLVDGEQTIIEAIQEVFSSPMPGPSLPYLTSITFKSISDNFLSDKDTQRDTARGLLENHGGVFIIDALSLYHPTIQRHLSQSNLFGERTPVAMVVLSPLKADKIPIHQILQKQVYPTYLEQSFKHFSHRLDPFFEFNVYELYSLRRWLFSVVPHYKGRSMSPDAQVAIVAEGGLPRGMVWVVSGGLQA